MKKNNKKVCLGIVVFLVLIGAIIIIADNYSKKVKKEYDTLENILAEVPQALKKQYDNMKLPNDISEINTDRLYVHYENLSGYKEEAIKDEAMRLFENITGMELTENDLLFDAQDNSVSLNLGFSDKNPDKWMGMYMSKGLFDVSTLDAAQMRSYSGEGLTKGKYFLKRGDSLEGSFMVGGEEYKLTDALEFAVKYVNHIGCIEYMNDGVTLEPSLIVVKEVKDEAGKSDGNCYYRIFFDVILDGVPLGDGGVLSSLAEEGYFKSANFYIMLDKKDHVGCIRHIGDSGIDYKEELEDKFITLESCLDLVSYFLASGSNYSVKEIGIRYCCLKKADETSVKRPYWKVVLSEKIGDDMFSTIQRCAFVDMVTGKVYLHDDYMGKILGESE